MYIIKKEVIHYGSTYGADTETIIESYGYDKLEDAIEYIFNEAIPDDQKAAAEYLDDPVFDITENGDKDDCETFVVVMDTYEADDACIFLETIYSIQCIQVRGE